MKRKARNYLLIYILVFVHYSSVFSQDRKLAADLFDNEDFESAYEEYSLLYENFKDDIEMTNNIANHILDTRNVKPVENIKLKKK